MRLRKVRVVRVLLGVTLPMVLAACGYSQKAALPPVGFTAGDLEKQNKGFVAFGARVSDKNTDMDCHLIYATLVRDQGGSAISTEVMRGTRNSDVEPVVLFGELPVGDYAISELNCYRDELGKTINSRYLAGDQGSFAKFAVKGGEVINLGMMTLAIQSRPRERKFIDLEFKPDGMSSMTLVEENWVNAINDRLRPDIRVKIQTRFMSPTFQVTPTSAVVLDPNKTRK